MNVNFSSLRIFKAPLLVLLALLALSEATGRPISIFVEYIRADIDSTTEGLILHSEYSRAGNKGPWHNIEYRYEVDGIAYTSSVVDYEGAGSNAIAKVKKYPAGKKVIVHFDSSNPSLAVLEVTELSISLIVSLLVCLTIFLLVLLWKIPTNRKITHKTTKDSKA